MNGAIPSISRLPAAPQPVELPGASASPGEFGRLLAGALAGVDQLGQQAQSSVERFLHGESEELHSMVLATQRAELGFELFMQVRNKVVQAYQEIMRMQI